MKPVGFRLMEPVDIVAVAAAEKAVFGYPWPREEHWRAAAGQGIYHILAIVQGSIAGYVGACWTGREAHILILAVLPRYRGQGIGTDLMQEMDGFLHQHGCESSTLEVRPSNKTALSIYSRLGFRSVGRRPHYYMDTDEDAEVMWKTKL
jgi:ribosomal-protein-alanine N-acetyltransferase